MVEPDTHDGAVENEADNGFAGQGPLVPGFPIGPHLSLDPADGILANRATKDSRKRTADAVGVGPRQGSSRR